MNSSGTEKNNQTTTNSSSSKEINSSDIFRQKNGKHSMNTDERSAATSTSSLIDSNQATSVSRIMRNTSLNLTSSSSSGQASKRLVIKNLKGAIILNIIVNHIFTPHKWPGFFSGLRLSMRSITEKYGYDTCFLFFL